MDIIKALSVEGFVAYYTQYCKKMDECSKNQCKFKQAERTDSENASIRETFNLMKEFQLVTTKYARMCALRELQEALKTYPEGSKEHRAVKIVLEQKQLMLKKMINLLGV